MPRMDTSDKSLDLNLIQNFCHQIIKEDSRVRTQLANRLDIESYYRIKTLLFLKYY
jgi:hypothetical protein